MKAKTYIQEAKTQKSWVPTYTKEAAARKMQGDWIPTYTKEAKMQGKWIPTYTEEAKRNEIVYCCFG
jgi:hypothetical protein